MIAACASSTARDVSCAANPAEDLIDSVARCINGEIAAAVVLQQPDVRRIDRIAELREREAGVIAAVHVDVEGGDVVIRDADLAGPVRCDPFAIVAGDRRTGRIQRPGVAAVGARADIDVRQAEAGDVDVVPAAAVLPRSGCQVGVAPALLHGIQGCLAEPFGADRWAALARRHLDSPDARVAGT